MRIRRAEKLIADKSSASELLSFYKRIASFQKSFLVRFSVDGAQQPENRQFDSVREGLDLTLLLPHFRNFLSLVEQNAPNALAATARELAAMPSDAWITLLSSYWELGGVFDQQIGAFAQFFPRAFLQPYAAYVAGRTAVPPVLATPRVCPLCGGRALFGVLRLEGDGGKRCMVCSFCGYEWEFRRILCPTCGRGEEKNFPCMWRSSFHMFASRLARRASFMFERLTLRKMAMLSQWWTTSRRFHLRFGRMSMGIAGCSRICWVAEECPTNL